MQKSKGAIDWSVLWAFVLLLSLVTFVTLMSISRQHRQYQPESQFAERLQGR